NKCRRGEDPQTGSYRGEPQRPRREEPARTCGRREKLACRERDDADFDILGERAPHQQDGAVRKEVGVRLRPGAEKGGDEPGEEKSGKATKHARDCKPRGAPHPDLHAAMPPRSHDSSTKRATS